MDRELTTVRRLRGGCPSQAPLPISGHADLGSARMRRSHPGLLVFVLSRDRIVHLLAAYTAKHLRRKSASQEVAQKRRTLTITSPARSLRWHCPLQGGDGLNSLRRCYRPTPLLLLPMSRPAVS